MADELGSGLPPAYNSVTGAYIPEAQLSQHLAKGTAQFRPGAMVPMIAPDGTLYHVPSESAIDTLGNGEGWQLDSPESQRARALEQASEEHPILAGIAAGASEAADVASFGQTAGVRALQSKASKALGGEGNFASDIEAIKRANPVATTIGTVGGALLGGVEGTGAKGVKALAEATGASRFIPGLGVLEAGAAGETGWLARAGAGVTKYGVGGAAEGTFYGAGMETARQLRSLGDQDMSAEKILVEAGRGGAFGGAFGGLLGGAGRLGGDFLSHTLSRDRNALKVIGFTNERIAKEYRVRGPEGVKKIVDNLMAEPGIIRPQAIGTTAEKLGAAREQAGADIGSFLKRLDEAPDYKPSWVGLGADLEKVPTFAEFRGSNMGSYMAEYGGHGGAMKALSRDYKALKQAVENQAIAEARSKSPMFNEIYDLLGDLRNSNIGPKTRIARDFERDWLPAIYKAKSLSELQGVRRDFDDSIKAVWRREQDSGKDIVLKKFRGILENNIENEANIAVQKAQAAGATNLVNDYLKLKARSQAMIVGAGAAEVAASKAQAGVGRLGIENYGRIGVGTVGGAVHGLGGIASLAVGAATDAAFRVAGSRPAAALIARAVDKLRGGVDASTMRLSNTVRSNLVKGSKALVQAVPAATGKVIDRYTQSSEIARQAKANPPVAVAKIERATSQLAQIDPNLASKLSLKLQGDLSWLTSKLPPPGMPSVFTSKGLPGGGGGGKRGRGRPAGKGGTMTSTLSVGGNATRSRISLTAASKFIRAEEALDRPLETIARMEHEGRLAPETVEMVRDRRPFMQEQIKNEMFDKISEMAERGKVPSRVTRVQMSLLTGEPLDPTMSREFIMGAQAIWAKERVGAAAPQAAPPRRETSRSIRGRAEARRSAGEEMEADDKDVG